MLDLPPGSRVVYLAMKPQLRGRFRRNVATLLELGADVTVLTVRTDKDFAVGLEHPRLHAEFLEARSLYVRYSQFVTRRAAARAARRLAPAAAPQTAPALPSKGLLAVAGVLWWVTRKVRGAPPAVATDGTSEKAPGPLRRAWHTVPEPVRASAWSAVRWQVRLRRRLVRWWRRALGRVTTSSTWVAGRSGAPRSAHLQVHLTRRVTRSDVRLREARRRRVLARRAALRRWRELRRAVINRRLAVSRGVVRRVKDLLRPWHRITRFFAFWRESAARAVELSPDLVVSSDLPGLVGAGRAARALGVGHVHDCHELYLESTSFRPTEKHVLQPMERHWFRRADAVVCVNDSIADEYRQRCGRRPVVVRNCAPRMVMDDDVRDLRELAGLAREARVVLYQGGFSGGRGLDVCVAAVAGLPADVHLVLLGFGPLREELVHQAGDLGLEGRVHIVDAVPPEELTSWTRSADVGLIPYQPVSRNNYLALPNKIFEYTAVGLPIVVSDLPELRRVALDEGCGQVYDPFDADSLTAALRDVLDPDRLPRYREAATRYGRDNVWENEREILISAFLGAAGRAGASRPAATAPDDAAR